MPSILSAYGFFEFPAPETWPADALRAFGRVTGERSLFDVFIFEHEFAGALYLEDAVLALTLLPITRAEWSTGLGYPQIYFDLSKMDQYAQGIIDAGYRVLVMARCAQQEPDHQANSRSGIQNGKVVSIASGRPAGCRRRHKWA